PVFVLVALTLLHQEVVFDPPAVPRPQVAPLMNVLSAQRLAGEPSVAGGLLHDRRRIRSNLLPAFLADYHMHSLPLPPRGAVLILDAVDPPETLLAVAPLLLQVMVGLQLPQPPHLFPHRRQRVVLQHDHELPMVLAAEGHDWPIRIES